MKERPTEGGASGQLRRKREKQVSFEDKENALNSFSSDGRGGIDLKAYAAKNSRKSISTGL